MELTRRYAPHSGVCGPNGDNGGGSIGHNEHMSQYSFGEWNTYNFAYSGTKYVSYPYVCIVSPCTASVEAGETLEASTSVHSGSEASVGGRAREIRMPQGPPFRVFDDGNTVFIDQDLRPGLDRYRQDIHEVGAQFISRIRDGEAVLTFAEPLTGADLAALVSRGIVLTTVEGSGIDAAGQRFSAGAPYSSDVWASLKEFTSETLPGSELEGVVAAEALIPDRAAFDAAVADPRVFAVDLSPAIAKAAAELAEAPSVNDLYWYVAGWETAD